MSKYIKITCDACGEWHPHTAYSPLWSQLKKMGWNKGPTPNAHFCPKATCQEHRACLLREAGKI